MSNTATAAPPVGGLELSRLEPLRPLPVHEVKRAMTEYQEGLAAVLAEQDWQHFTDRDGNSRKFVKRSGWRKIATWFGLDLFIGRITVERDERGRILRAEIVARAVGPNGRVAEDVGACALDEPRTFYKPEHDLRATAATRALNRAISNLVGMGDVSAEEIADDIEPLLPEWAQPCPPEAGALMLERLTELVGAERALALTNAIGGRYDGVPNIVTGLVSALHSMLKPAPADEPTPTSTQESDHGI